MFRIIAFALASVLPCHSAGGQDFRSHHRPRREPVIDPAVALAAASFKDDAVRVWVFFVDKGIGSRQAYEAALAQAEEDLHPRALRRRGLRRTRPGLVDYNDLPLTGPYVNAVLTTGAKLRTTSEWLNAVSVEATAPQIATIAKLPFVAFIKPLSLPAPIERPSDAERTGAWLADGGPEDFYGMASEQLNQINIPAVHAAGFTGAGIVIGVLDTGFKRTHQAYNEPGHPIVVLGEYDFINGDGNTAPEPGDDPWQHWHGTAVLGTIAAYKPDTLVGGAYDAAFLLAKTEDITQEVPVEEDWYVAGLQWIEANGGDVATSSLGYIDWYTQSQLNGQTAVTTIAVNIATANGLACCTAAGNEGHDSNPVTSHLIAPADAFQVLSCGAVSSEGSIVGFSSDGPTADGRVKPEVLARGARTWTLDPDNDTGYMQVSGTSLSTPLVASAVALIVQAHPDWSVDQIRAAFLRTASDYVQNGFPDPLFVRGYGIIDTLAAVNMSFIGDLDRDGDVDLSDFTSFQLCFGGSNNLPAPTCPPGVNADLDGDGDVDLADFLIFQQNFTGSL